MSAPPGAFPEPGLGQAPVFFFEAFLTFTVDSMEVCPLERETCEGSRLVALLPAALQCLAQKGHSQCLLIKGPRGVQGQGRSQAHK